jgi:uncharacterized metal-binding protein YceD (DUF177 family)
LGTLKTYRIDLKSLLPSTTYTYEYVLDESFFEEIDGPEVKQGKVNVAVEVIRASSAFELNFDIEGVVMATCDRCLDDVEVSVEAQNRLIVTFGEAFDDVGDDHIVIDEEDGTIDLSWYLYEFVALAMPLKRVHEPGGCNEQMVGKLRELCVEDSSSEDETDEDYEADEDDETDEDYEDDETDEAGDNEGVTDPRWDALRRLKI